jgi:hypothetical protein
MLEHDFHYYSKAKGFVSRTGEPNYRFIGFEKCHRARLGENVPARKEH